MIGYIKYKRHFTLNKNIQVFDERNNQILKINLLPRRGFTEQSFDVRENII